MDDDRPTFNNTIVIGVGAEPEDCKADGDILFSTGVHKLLISEGVVYLNTIRQSRINAMSVETIVKAFEAIIGVRLEPKDATDGAT